MLGARLNLIFLNGMDSCESVIYCDALAHDVRYLRDCMKLIEDLSSTFRPSGMRVSDGPDFSFCRMNCGWTGFVAPSTVLYIH